MIMIRDVRVLISIIVTKQIMEKTNTDKTISSRPVINLKNSFSSEIGFRDSRGGQLLFDKDSSLSNAMKPITPNETR